MAWYSAPIRPMDPVIEDEKDNQAIRYLRDNFSAAGQDSNTQPPAQNPASWQQLTNVQPITQSVLSRRWGYQLFLLAATGGSPTPPITRAYPLQNNITLSRQLIFSSQGNVFASPEDGSSTTNVFNPIGPLAPRMVDSRNFAYFYDGTQADLIKWDTVSTTSNWGIAPPSLATLAVSAGPFGGSAQSISGTGTTWTNPGNVFVQDGNNATTTTLPSNVSSKFINVTGFGFAIPANATITGVRATVFGSASGTSTKSAYNATLLKAGTPYGFGKFAIAPHGVSSGTQLPAGSSDLWGGTWTPADINNANFGIQFSVTDIGSPMIGTSWLIDYIGIQIFYTTNTSAITVAVGGAGNITLTVGRTYFCVFQNSTTGQFSDLNQTSASSGPCTLAVINLSNIPVSTDPQVDSKVILATADGGDPSILYFVATITNATTTYTDNLPETTLDLNQQYLFTDPFGNEFGVTFNDPPPNGSVCIKHKGRLWMAQDQNLFFSKATAELTLPNGFIAGKYEECWPPQNYFDISAGAETISGLLSDGNVIYVGTQSHIRRIFGDSPANFQQPEICHQDVGVLNQETWQNVFLQGTPTGFVWLSPDFKVMGSDGNTYLDLGHPIQDVLNTINPAAAQNAHAMFVQQGPYDLYILAIPTGNNTTCDTHCVFDLRDQHWIIWQPTDPSTAMVFNLTSIGTPQWLFATQPNISTNVIYQYTPLANQDRVNNTPVNFTSTALTPWLHLGSPTTRKILDEMEIIGDETMTISIFGALTESDFDAPSAIVSGVPLVLGPFGTYKVFLAGKASKHKYYQFQFQSSSTDPEFLNAFSCRVIPWNTV